MENGKVFDKLQKIEVAQAVIIEKLSTLAEEVHKDNMEYTTIKKRVDNHDKIVGAIVLVVTMLGTLVKFKLI